MRRPNRLSPPNAGFTLVELLITMAVMAIMTALIASAYWAQAKTTRDQQMVVEMQQNMRAAMFYLQREIRMAGYNDEVDITNDTTVVTAEPDTFTFDYEEDETGDIIRITYVLAGGNIARRVDRDADGSFETQEIARNIEGLEFFYTIADGRQSTDPTDGGGLGADPEDIRAVGISILARTRGPGMSGAVENATYTTLSGTAWGPYNDGRRRQLITATVMCRNMFDDEI